MAKLIGQGMRERGDDTQERVAGRTQTRVAAVRSRHDIKQNIFKLL